MFSANDPDRGISERSFRSQQFLRVLSLDTRHKQESRGKGTLFSTRKIPIKLQLELDKIRDWTQGIIVGELVAKKQTAAHHPHQPRSVSHSSL